MEALVPQEASREEGARRHAGEERRRRRPRVRLAVGAGDDERAVKVAQVTDERRQRRGGEGARRLRQRRAAECRLLQPKCIVEARVEGSLALGEQSRQLLGRQRRVERAARAAVAAARRVHDFDPKGRRGLELHDDELRRVGHRSVEQL